MPGGVGLYGLFFCQLVEGECLLCQVGGCWGVHTIVCNESSVESFGEVYCFALVQVSGTDHPERSHQEWVAQDAGV